MTKDSISNTPSPNPPDLVDVQQRRRAVDPISSFHLEAPAGSGKTSLLTARFLRLLGVVEHPRQILALTFTNKAAGEMRERVCTMLTRAANGSEPSNPQDVEMLDAAAAALKRHKERRALLLGGDFLQILTFHSFCFTLVSQAPLEAGIIPGASLLAETDQAALLRETIDTTLMEIMERAAEDPWRRAAENRLLYLNNSWPILAKELEEIMQRREALGDLIGVLSREKAAESFLAGLRELAETELGALDAAFRSTSLAAAWGDFICDLERKGGSAAALLPGVVPGGKWEDLAGWADMANVLLTNAGGPRKQAGPDKGFYPRFSKTSWYKAIQEIPQAVAGRLHAVRELPLPDAANPNVDALWDLVLLIQAVAEAYERRCRKLRLLDFSDLEMAALRLFDGMHPTDLQLLLDHQIRHVLVDEFQDTSRQQWLLLKRLCAGWMPGDGRTLFVVGDPKQSIYGFRKAEVNLFMEAAAGLPLESSVLLPLESLRLGTNFRSTPGLIKWCNCVFGRTVMRNPRPELDEVGFTAAAAPNPDGCGGAEATPCPCGGGDPDAPELALFVRWPDAASGRAREAAWIARSIALELTEGNLRPDRTIGILLFARTHLPVYLTALQERHVAVQVAEGLKLTDRPEVEYLWQLCRALVLPHDHLAWAVQLRSPWLSLDYGGMFAVFSKEAGPWVEKIRAFARENEEVRIFWENLREARQRLGHEPLADVLEAAWLSLGGARLTAERWGGRGLACCRRFLDLVAEAEVFEPVRTVQRVEELLKGAFEPVDPDAASSRVHLMTVHRAKGLEFDSVYLPFLDWNPLARERMERPPYLLERGMLASGRYLLAMRPDRRGGEIDPVYRMLQKLHLGRRWGEARRLFYVAATRARSRLSMSAVLPLRRDGVSPSFPADTVLSWLNEHYGLQEALDSGGEAPGEKNIPCDASHWSREWQGPEENFPVFVEPSAAPPEEEDTVALPVAAVHPASFEREMPAYRILHPSTLEGALSGEISSANGPLGPSARGSASGVASEGSPEADRRGAAPHARILGVLIHRLFEHRARHGELPSLDGVAALARREGACETEGANLARLALSEVNACLEEPQLNELYRLAQDQLFVEQPVEAVHSSRTLFSGVVDLVARVGNRWRLVDFKTARSCDAEDPEEFCRRESQKYWPQLLAYREMWAKARGIDESEVDVAIFWTACRRWELFAASLTDSPSAASG